MADNKRYGVRILLFFTLLVSGLFAQEDKLQVGVSGNEPFVVQDGENVSGLSVDVWEQMALNAGEGFDYQSFESVQESLAKLESGEVDIVAGPITITADRQAKFDFTQPYFNSSLGIVSKDLGFTVWERIKPFFSKTFFVALGVFLVILTTVGFLVWVVERRTDGGPFSDGPVKGLGNGIWLALVTMTTVGYGDLAPRTVMGRIVLGSWMVVALVSATSLLAGLAGTIALSSRDSVKIETAGDLNGKRVAVVSNSPSVEFVSKHEGQKVYADSLDDAMNLLKNDTVSAVVFDRPQMRYYLEQNPLKNAVVSPQKYRRQGYGFAFRKGDPRAESYNLILLKLQEEGVLSSIERDWFPEVVK